MIEFRLVASFPGIKELEAQSIFNMAYFCVSVDSVPLFPKITVTYKPNTPESCVILQGNYLHTYPFYFLLSWIGDVPQLLRGESSTAECQPGDIITIEPFGSKIKIIHVPAFDQDRNELYADTKDFIRELIRFTENSYATPIKLNQYIKGIYGDIFESHLRNAKDAYLKTYGEKI